MTDPTDDMNTDSGFPLSSKRSVNDWWKLVRAAGSAWSDDDASSMGAALSYYTVFSLAPLLLIVISIAGLLFGQDAARGEIFSQLAGLMGQDAAQAIEGLLASVSEPRQSLAATLVGVAVLVVGATTVFAELQGSLDRIWRAPARDKLSGLWSLLRTRLLSFGMILGIAFLLMVSLVLGAVISALGKWWGGAFGGWEVLAQVVNLLVGFALTTVVFAMIYKLMPRVKIRWHDVWLGAFVTAVLFTVGKFLIGLYIGKSGVASGFGAAGSLIVIFLWVYYSAQIFLLGAEFTWVYALTFGSMRGMADAEIRASPSMPGQAVKQLDLPEAAAPAVAVASGTGGVASLPPVTVPALALNLLAGLGLRVAVALAARYLLKRLARQR